jgi:tRNA-dihydrouridine synthase B
MVGRGSYGRPWFLNQVSHYLKTGEKLPDPSLEIQRDVVLEHYEHMLSHYGTVNGVMVARKHIGWYSSGLTDSAQYRQFINTLTNPDEVKTTIRQFYDGALEQHDLALAA